MTMRSVLCCVAWVLACGGSSPSNEPADDPLPGEEQPGDLPATPFDTPEGEWTYVPIEGSSCGNGTQMGVGVNLGPRRDQVFVYLQGGGACWDALTCYAIKSAVRTESAYDAAAFAAEKPGLEGAKLLDRDDPTNPFREASFIYVPYCTGDLHSGHTDQTYDASKPTRVTHHRGGDNMARIIARARATFPVTQSVWFAGTSAGGFGVQLNYPAMQEAFSETPVHVLADSAQPVTPNHGLWAVMQSAWAVSFTDACEHCTERPSALLDMLDAKHPDSRVGLLAYEKDPVLSGFFGYSKDQMKALTLALVAAQAGREQIRSFVLPNEEHGMLDDYGTLSAPDGKTLQSFVTKWATGDASWTDATRSARDRSL